ncbi:hypothetical protein RIF29_21811 [Crotalaria pallida]|uniref:RIN4 pathogenic type III effector avirulence factor Avr cleavage site domain-containing protein n=1 Tax=Crotalaria pallida TaxID=3830 RepID=A0AAN9I9T0_CROPI
MMSLHAKMDEWRKRSGQIPAFGNWDLENDMPITQYFDCPRQAGLLRYSNSSSSASAETESDLYTPHSHKPTPHSAIKHEQGTRNRERRCPVAAANGMVKEKKNVNGNVIISRKQGKKVYDVVTEQPRKAIRVSKQLHQHDTVPRSPPSKPVDEDLYKISPDLLHTTKRKKMLGFISKCLVPGACVS